ncbi:MAG: hypothetical protein IKE95_08605 [Methanobrevibacter sp.]|nr:hypothetical protein [Methanobrevibacter sp.]
MKIDKLPIGSNTMCVQVVSSNTNHIVYCLDENVDVIQVTSISEATVDEVVAIIPHMVIIVLDPHKVFNMMCGFKLRAGHIFEPDFYPYDHLAWRYFLDKEKLLIVREMAKQKNVANYESSKEHQQKKHRITDYIFARPTPIEQRDEAAHQRMVEARRYELGALQNWIV